MKKTFLKYPQLLLTLLIGTASISLLMLGFEVSNYRRHKSPKNPDGICQQIIKSDAIINQTKLNQLQVKEGVQKSVIREILGDPYCVLPKASIRSGVITEREAYRKSEDSRLIVAYENNQYLGYGLEKTSKPKFGWFVNRPGKNQQIMKQIELKKVWEIQSGEFIAGYRVVGGLGDISLDFKGAIKSPALGVVESNFMLVSDRTLIRNPPDCVIFSSPQMPAYLLKICGLKRRKLGTVNQGSPIGHTNGYLHMSLLSFRKDQNQVSKWIYVSPSPKLIEKLLRES